MMSTSIRLSPRARKLMLLAHIAAAGSWLGIDLVLGILVVTTLTADAVDAAAAAASIASFATWPLVTVGLITLVTGVVLGLGSKYGLIRYWWVFVKLVLNIVLVTLVLLALTPGVALLADVGRDAIVTGTMPEAPANLLFPPIVSSTAVLAAIALSVFKPWGRTGRGRRLTSMANVKRDFEDARR
jgi:hypothetical protein